MRHIIKLWDHLLDALKGVAAILVVAMTFGVCADIILRTMGTGGLPWVFDFVEYSMLVVTALATAHVLRNGQHVNIDLVVSFLPDTGRHVSRVLGAFLCFAISLTLTWFALRVTLQSYHAGSRIFRYLVIPEWIPYGFVLLMFALLSVETLRQVFVAIQAGRDRAGSRSDTF